MGLITDFDSRNLLHRTSRMWGESTAIFLAVGLTAGCASRLPPPQAEPPTAPKAVNAPEKTSSASGVALKTELAPGEISLTSSADNHTHLRLAPLPDLQEGDLIHVLAHERVIATALVTAIDTTSATALVTGLTDRSRPVALGDVAIRLIPKEVLSTAPAVSAPSAAPSPPETAPVAPPVVDPAAPMAAPASPPPATPAAAEHPKTVITVVEATPALPLTAEAPPTAEAPTAGLTPEVRARLTAERAYFDLATRVLRLPAAGPELTELQARLRNELASLELLP